jgi:hypothetical protein
MTVGIVMLLIGSTGIGYPLSINLHPVLRTILILLSSVVIFGSIILFSMITGLLFSESSI